MAAIGILHADIGITLALGLLIAIPVVAACGPLFSHVAARWVPIGAAGAGLAFVRATAGGTAAHPATRTAGTGNGGQAGSDREQTATPQEDSGPAAPQQGSRDPEAKRSPSFRWTLTTVLSPVVLMLLRAAADLWVDPHSALYKVLGILGDPVVVLLIAELLAMVTFGTTVGFSASTLGKKIGASLLPIVGVLLIVGAGGGFKQVLVDGGTGTAIGKFAVAASLSAPVLGWIVAVLIRVSTGSATVATVTAAGIVAPWPRACHRPSWPWSSSPSMPASGWSRSTSA